MGFIEVLNKYAYKAPINDTKIYKDMLEYKQDFINLGLSFKINNENDLFDYEIIYRGLRNRLLIEQTYEYFISENFDMLNYLGYEEKRLMFNNDLHGTLLNARHYTYQQQNIYIPFMDESFNYKYYNDYQLLKLKQYQEYLNNYKINQKKPYDLYGLSIYQSSFSSLKNVYEDHRHLCLYFDDLKKIYIYKKENYELLNYIYITDYKTNQAIDLEIVKTISHYIELYLYKECLEYMFEKKLIHEKTYKKIIKKYK